MGLQDKRAAARERNRREQEAGRARQRRYTKTEELRRLGVPVPSWDERALDEDALDAMLAAEKQRRTELYERFVRAGTVTTFRALGVQILTGDDKVYTIGQHDPYAKTNGSRLLGPLAGAQAMVTDGAQAWSPGRAMFLPIGLAGLATKTVADAAVVFPDGTVHTRALNGSAEVREAQKQTVEFNSRSGGGSGVTATGPSDDPAARLQKLQELRDAGLLSQEEYDAKRADIIASL
ncbi:MAG TPA: SHOCT domain-containing protein [Streptosporangiaceae bacterium]|nr:SHOCT domain-containing protein [Streptosporangiaceae bacterium]